MSAKKKTIIALIVGAVLGVVFAVFEIQQLSGYEDVVGMSRSDILAQSLIMIPCFMLYAFGYAFGWKRCKGFVAKAAKVSADVTFMYLIVQLITGKGFGKGIIIAMLIFSFAIGIVWLPGIVFGIKELITEHKANAYS